MHSRVLHWLGHEFVELAGEAQPGLSSTEAVLQLLDRFERELGEHGLSLDNTVRTRLWACDRAARDEGSSERARLLAGRRRSASSSYIAPDHLVSEAVLALDLVAMRSTSAKSVREYEPPIVPPRYAIWDDLVFLSGVTSVLTTLPEQLDDVLARISGSMREAGASWESVVQVECFVHRSQAYKTVQEGLPPQVPLVGFASVDGYSSVGKLVEVEVTAQCR
jgi:enamine deaminase RidA (YjgF/YER057c/UK114 family)